MNVRSFFNDAQPTRAELQRTANVATLMKVGHFRKVSGPSRRSNHTERNRFVLVLIASSILVLGFFSIIL
jgi:hypothetical protein